MQWYNQNIVPKQFIQANIANITSGKIATHTILRGSTSEQFMNSCALQPLEYTKGETGLIQLSGIKQMNP